MTTNLFILPSGLHLEGPFISKDKKGAHPLHCIRGFPNGFRDVLDVYSSLEGVGIVTLAPELPNAASVIRELSQRGIAVSLGLYFVVLCCESLNIDQLQLCYCLYQL